MSEVSAAADEDEPGLARRTAVVVALATLASATAWAFIDNTAPLWDQARHALNSLRLLELAREVALSPLRWGDLWVWHDQQYGLAAYAVPAAVQAFTGASFLVCKLVTTWTWLPLLLLSAWSAGGRIAGNTWSGAGAVCFLVASPMVLDFAKDFTLDLPLLACTALVLALLVRSEFMVRLRDAVDAGAALGLLMLTKVVVPLTFLGGPAVYTVLRARKLGTGRVVARHAALAALAFLVVAGPTYVRVLPEMQRLIANQARDAAAEGDPTSWLASARMYAGWIPTFHVNVPSLAWLVAGGVMAWRRHRGHAMWLVGGILAAWLAWPLFPNKDARYPLGWMALGAVLAGYAVTTRAAAHAALAWALFMVASVHWGVGALPPRVALGDVVVWQQHGYLRGAPVQQEDVPTVMVNRAMDVAAKEVHVAGWLRRALVGVDLQHDEGTFNAWNLAWRAWAEGRELEIFPARFGVVDVDLFITNDCGDAEVRHAGWQVEFERSTADGCSARLWRSPSRAALEKDIASRAAVEHSFTLGQQARTITALGTASERDADGNVMVGVRTRVGTNRRPVPIRHVLRVGQASAEWTTSDERYREGDTILATPLLRVPAGMGRGGHPAQLEVSAEGAPPVSIPLGTLEIP